MPYSQYDLPKRPPAISVTADDEQILLEAYRHDVIDAGTIRLLLPHRSSQNLGRRLNLLRKTRHLIRLHRSEQRFFPGGGSFPKSYALGQRGYEHLKAAMNLPPKVQRYQERAAKLTATTISHALEQTRFLVATRQSVEEQPGVQFLYPEQIYADLCPEILVRPSLPSIVQSKVVWSGYQNLEGTIPDGFFQINNPAKEIGSQRRTVFLEIDRGTMTIDTSDQKMHRPSFWRDNTLLKKFIIYEFAYRTKVHKRQFGVESFQVLTVTTNAARTKNIQDMYRKRLHGKPLRANPYLFLFTDFETIAGFGHDVANVPLENGLGEIVSLIP